MAKGRFYIFARVFIDVPAGAIVPTQEGVEEAIRGALVSNLIETQGGWFVDKVETFDQLGELRGRKKRDDK
jgi:hypothetical protein